MRILVVEDEERITQFLKKGLEEESYAVDMAADGPAALDWVAGAQYDVILLDVMLPGLNGFEVSRILRECGVTTPILMLTARDEVDDRVTGLDSVQTTIWRNRSPSRSYWPVFVPSPAGSRLIHRSRLRCVWPTSAWTPSRIRPNAAGASSNSRPKSYGLLEYLMRHAGRTLSRTLIRENIWGYDYYGASNVVDVYVRHLRQKLEANGELPLIETVRGVGYKIDEPE